MVAFPLHSKLLTHNVINRSCLDEHHLRTRSPRTIQNVISFSFPHTIGLVPLYRFYAGCSTFLPIFDCQVDTFEALHERSPIAVDAICMVAARVKDGGGGLLTLLCYPLISSTIRRCERNVPPMFRSGAGYFVYYAVYSGESHRICTSNE